MAKRKTTTLPVFNPLHEMSDEEVDATLTPEERADMEELHQGLADGTIVSLLTEEEHQRLKAIARATLDARGLDAYGRKKDTSKRITVRITLDDLQSLQQKAREQGLPYQTLLKSVVHQYLTGQLVPRA